MRKPSPGLLVGLLIGVPMMLVGIVGLAQHSDATPPSSFLRFFVGGDVLHDLIVAPLACVIGVLVIRRLPRVTRVPIGSALFASAVVLALSWPALRGYGRDRAPDNHSVQPLNYATAVATVLVIIWFTAVAWLLAIVLRRAHDRRRC